MSKMAISALLLLVSIIATACLIRREGARSNITHVRLADTVVKVEIADSVLKKSRGLGGKNSLNDDEGMLFIFSTYNKHSFWMKGMNFPIDIIWLRDSEVVDITKNLSPESFPNSYSPVAAVNYVLEVKAGFSDKHKVVIGQKVEYLDRRVDTNK